MANRTSFRPGEDSRRHVFKPEECSEGGRKGFATIMNEKPEILLWLKKKLRGFYRGKRSQR